jgi:aryl-alcohol dehydrogenase-like predicted oxidoreductase
MRSLKEEGRIQKIGFSLYNTQQLQYLFDRNVQFDIIQFPYNIFDRQFEPWLPKLKNLGVEVHTRSAFLQGLFFKDVNTIEGKLKPMCPYLVQLQDYCQHRNITVEQIAFGYVLSHEAIDGALIGVDNHQQLERNLEVSHFQLKKEDIDFIRSINIKENELLNPVNWK